MEILSLGTIVMIVGLITWLYIVHETRTLNAKRELLRKIENDNAILKTKINCITATATDPDLSAFQAIEKIKHHLNVKV